MAPNLTICVIGKFRVNNFFYETHRKFSRLAINRNLDKYFENQNRQRLKFSNDFESIDNLERHEADDNKFIDHTLL